MYKTAKIGKNQYFRTLYARVVVQEQSRPIAVFHIFQEEQKNLFTDIVWWRTDRR